MGGGENRSPLYSEAEDPESPTEPEGPEGPEVPEGPEEPEEPTGPDIIFPETMRSGTLPTIFINTEGYAPIIDKETKIPATLYIDCSMSDEFEDLGSPEKPLELTIKGRGNVSWTNDKKPYKIKFEKKQAPLGLTKSKHFALLAETDRLYLTSFWGFELGRAVEMAWTPAFQPVELVLNGNYEGLYLLIESVKIQEGRVDIFEQPEENTDPETIPYGWLVEVDNYLDEFQITVPETADKNVLITHKSPEILSEDQRQWLSDEFTDICRRLDTDDILDPTWTEKMDIHSLAQYFIVSELLGNKDAYTGSFYFHKDSGEGAKWKAGPLWDLSWTVYDDEWMFDSRPDKHVHFIKQALKYPVFVDEVNNVWETFTPELMEKLYTRLCALSDKVRPVIENDEARWPQYAGHSNIDYLKKHLIPERYGWVRDNLETLAPDVSGLESPYIQAFDKVFIDGGKLNVVDPGNVVSFGLYDASGRRLICDAQSEIDLEGLSKGLYLISVVYDDGHRANLKFAN